VEDHNAYLFLLCRVRALHCVLPLAQVAETMRPLPITALPGMPPSVLGVSLIRGHPTPVVDAARLLDGERLDATRLVLLKTGERRVALLVDDVSGIRSFPPDSVHELPPLIDDSNSGLISALGRADAGLLLVLRTARLVPEETWAELDALRYNE
jgi:purine-binding chemotaxis protein CheW